MAQPPTRKILHIALGTKPLRSSLMSVLQLTPGPVDVTLEMDTFQLLLTEDVHGILGEVIIGPWPSLTHKSNSGGNGSTVGGCILLSTVPLRGTLLSCFKDSLATWESSMTPPFFCFDLFWVFLIVTRGTLLLKAFYCFILQALGFVFAKWSAATSQQYITIQLCMHIGLLKNANLPLVPGRILGILGMLAECCKNSSEWTK